MSMDNDVRVTVRIEKSLKENADSLFERLGMNMSTALNVFLRKAVDENAIPFPISAKPAGFIAGMTPDNITRSFENAVSSEIEKSKKQCHPVARYDAAEGRAYLEYSDGSKEYVGD